MVGGSVQAERQLERLINLAKDDPEILAVVLYGSVARGEASRDSDVDICLVLMPLRREPSQLSAKRFVYLKEVDLDVQVFQQLPVYIRQRVLKEGKVLFVRDEDALYDVAFRTVQAFEDFRPYYRAYLTEVARAGS
jgi:predicted nucleotidyltransferase